MGKIPRKQRRKNIQVKIEKKMFLEKIGKPVFPIPPHYFSYAQKTIS